MSRFCGEKQVGPILLAAEHWKQVGLLAEGSVLGEGAVWTLRNLQFLDENFVKKPDDGDGGFFEKLEPQIEDTPAEVKMLAAEMLWVLFLCPSNISPGKKIEGIETIWRWSGDELPLDSEYLAEECLTGVGSAGTGFNTNRWREVVFFIRLMLSFKQFTDSERRSLLEDGWKFAEWLESIPECDTRQFRHMILFLLFPDDFERIFGGTDRRLIAKTFLGKKVKGLSALQIDHLLSDIRREQEAQFGSGELDFYVPPLRGLWKDEIKRSWLFSWNPANWKWESFDTDREITHAGKTVTHAWRCSNQDAAIGDKAYLVKAGTPPRGIIAVGNVVSEPYEDSHWDEERAAKGETCSYVEIAFSQIQDPARNDPYVTEEDLSRITVDNQTWSPQSSGIEIKQRSAGILEKLWNSLADASPQQKDQLKEISQAKNLILFGPPGTGKTYHLNKLVQTYTSKKQTQSREAWLTQQLLDVRWFDVIIATLYALGEQAKVGQIAEHDYVKLKARAMGRTRNVAQTIWATLQSHTIENSATVQYKSRSAPQVFDKAADSTWGLVGSWREECADQVALAESWKKGPANEAPHQRYEYVTFHQAYSYEDFIEGIRPVQDEESGELVYQVVDGVFKRICQRAKADPEQRYAIFIDEINRGNIAKIFGELITLIEPDKRAVYDVHGVLLEGMELTLPYSATRYGVPRNLDIYGAMNTADRSIALLDTALRRRFHFKELMPDSGVISGSRGDGYIEDGLGGVINLRAMLDAMNARIRFLLNRDVTLGHAYFINVRDFNGLRQVLMNQVIPLLQEYFYQDWHRIQLVFRDVGPGNEKLEPQIIVHEEISEEAVLGFDHDDFDDMIDYRVAREDDITPDAVRKIYEDLA